MKKYILLIALLSLSGCIFNGKSKAVKSPSIIDMGLNIVTGALDGASEQGSLSSLAMAGTPIGGLLAMWSFVRGRRHKKVAVEQKKNYQSNETGSSLFFHAILESSDLLGAKSIASLAIKSQQQEALT
mgnify:CR=1 FL=1